MSVHARRRKRTSNAALRMLSHAPLVHCPKCDRAPDRNHYWIDPFDKTPRCGLLTIYCEHCQTIARTDIVLEGGLWHPIGNVEYIEDEPTRRAIIARAEEHSVTQVNAA